MATTEGPGLFFHLVRDGVVSLETLAPLMAALPPEKYVSTSVRGGEGYDSTRWPIVRDLVLARHVAWRLPDLEAGVLEAIETTVADGLYAYHVHRSLPGTGAELAANIVRRAISGGALTAEKLVGDALTLAQQNVADRPLGELFLRLREACLDVAQVAGVPWCGILTPTLALPTVPEGINFLILAGPRALVGLSFEAEGDFTPRIREFRGRSLDLREHALTLVVPAPELPPQDHAPAAVASLLVYVDTMLDAHVTLHPADEQRFPILDDAALEDMFG